MLRMIEIPLPRPARRWSLVGAFFMVIAAASLTTWLLSAREAPAPAPLADQCSVRVLCPDGSEIACVGAVACGGTAESAVCDDRAVWCRSHDRCPYEPEDADGDRDDDGCPDP